MSVWLSGVLLALCALAALYAVVLLVRDRPADDPTYVVLGLIELLLIGQLVGGLVALSATDREIEGTVFVSYLVTVALVPLAGAFVALVERTRAGVGGLLLALLTVAALEARLLDIWQGVPGA